MFTGIIEELGEVLAWEPAGDAARITVRAPLAVSDAAHGDSIAVSGVCLTVVDQGADWFTADVMGISIEVTTLETWNKVVAVTQTSVFLGMKAAGEALKASGHGSVVNISSMYGIAARA